MLKKKTFMVFVAIITILIFLCLPVFGATKDEKKPPDDDEQVPTVIGTINY
ncbi:MAG TPA: hypothetical protein P5294_08250 [Smithellaceae bacterium]|nr:hypothetical protein [Smithellaceae bacterium]HRS88753.1 hypothetical protein [Smithellaceae bacterium]HRV26516.1 hypothetical protein [Smithellaceae bacterium]